MKAEKRGYLAKFDNAVYWHDTLDNEDDVLADLRTQVLHPCKQANIILGKYRMSELPQVLEEAFDILFFDWGGMSLGNSLMEHFCRHILKHAEDHPNRFYVMVSSFTSEAMNDAIKEMGDEKPFNVHLSVESLKDWLIKMEN